MEGFSAYNKTESSSELFQAKKNQYTVEIRKNKRDFDITLKRLKLTHRILSEDHPAAKKSRDPSLVIKDFFDSLQDGDLILAEKATAEIRECIARPNTCFNQVYDLFMESGVIQNMIDLLDKKYSNHPKLQEDVSMALCNFTAGDSLYLEFALKKHVLETLIQALDFASGKFLENCLWTLANMSGESKAIQDAVLALISIDKLTEIIYTNRTQIEILRTSIWLLSNLTRGVSYEMNKAISRSLPLIAEICSCQDEVVLEYTLWTFCYFCEDFDSEKVTFSDSTGIIKFALKLLSQQTNPRIKSLAFRLCSCVLLANTSFSQILNEKQYINALVSYLKDYKNSRCKEAYKTLANLILKYPVIIEKSKEMELMTPIIETLIQGNTEVRIDAMMCLYHIVCKCDEATFFEALNSNIFTGIAKSLESINVELVILSLTTLLQILQRTQILGTKLSNLVFQKLREADLINAVEGLMSYKNEVVVEKACKIIDEFFKCAN